MKKIILSFVVGVLLSIVPITGLAASGKTFNIKRNFSGNCPDAIWIPLPIGPHFCIKTGESCSNGVCVCSYTCKIKSGFAEEVAEVEGMQ